MSKIIFSKEVVRSAKYKVDDPWSQIHPFFALKLAKYGFITLPEDLEEKLLNKKRVKTADLDDSIKYALCGNRLDNLEFHLENIKDYLDEGNDIWINIFLLKDFIPHLNKFEGVEIVIEGFYNPYEAQHFEITGEGLSALLGLFGKFNNVSLSRNDAIKIGKLQENLKFGLEVSKDELEEASSIVKLEKSKNTQLPSLNLYNKLIETISLYKVA